MPSSPRPCTDITTLFGRTLGAVRALAGYSQTELAERVPVDRSAIARFEIGRTTTSVPMLVAIERPLLASGAIRRPGDLMLLTMRTASRLRAEGASVYLDRPPSGALQVPLADVVAAATAVVREWADELAADGVVPGPRPLGERDPHAEDPGRYEQARWMTDEEEADLLSQEPPPKGFIRATVARAVEDEELMVSRRHLRSQTRREEDIEPKARREGEAEPKASRFIRPTGRGPAQSE